MRLRIPLLITSLSALVLSGRPAQAQLLPADEFFHGGARSYLTNNIGGALQWVTNGLAVYPKDEKLKKLEELLKQQQQQQNQDQQNNSQQDQQKSQNPDQQKSQDQKHSDKDKDQQQAKKSDEQKKPDKDSDQEGQAVAAGEMTPQEAKQLLDAQKNDEQLMPVSRKDKPRDQLKVLKDW